MGSSPRTRRRTQPAKPAPKSVPTPSRERSVAVMKNQPTSHAKSDAQPNGSVGADDLSGGNLDKVRDILFGNQIRDSDRRFQRLEDRLVQETSELKDEVRKRLSMLEQFVKQELESLADRISS